MRDKAAILERESDMNAKWIIMPVLVLLLHGSAFGQGYVLQDGPSAGDTFHDSFRGSSYGGYGESGGYGTVEGSILFGLGAFARGVGEYNYYTGMAVRDLEQARTVAIKNHKTAVENWHSLRKAHSDRRQAEWEKERLTPAEVAHIVKVSRPDRLTPAQYEPATGKIIWPAPLMGDEFAAERAQLEDAFARRTVRDAGPDSAFYDQVRRLTEKMLNKLRQKNDESEELTPMQFIAGKKFLVGLKYESHTPIDVEALVTSE
jgi:hypothetical protein